MLADIVLWHTYGDSFVLTGWGVFLVVFVAVMFGSARS